MRTTTARVALAVVLTAALPAYGHAAATHRYATMAPVSKYLMTRQTEIAMARSAAPESIAARATVLVMTRSGYVNAVRGSNGWVCLVERMWSAGLDDPEFWNPKGRGAACFNPDAAQAVLPFYLSRAKWALEGDTREQIATKSKAGYARHVFEQPRGFALMLSKQSYLNDEVAGPWRPHIMPFVTKDALPKWGAGSTHSPILAPGISTFRSYEPVPLVIPVASWSDGSPVETKRPPT